MKYLCIAACIKNEGRFLREWVEFHRIVGVEHFYLYNNNSADNTREILGPYIDSGVVTLTDCPMDACQLACYFHAIYYNRKETHWLAFIDADEFLFCPTGETLPSFLSGFERHPGVVAQWAVFGSNGHKVRPEGLIIENYTKRAPLAADKFGPNKHIKSIINPATAICPAGAHYFHTRGEHPVVNEKYEANPGPFMVGESSSEKIRINHYFCRSREDFAEKMARGRATVPSRAQVAGEESTRAATQRTWKTFDFHDRNDVEDTTIHRYLKELRRTLSS